MARGIGVAPHDPLTIGKRVTILYVMRAERLLRSRNLAARNKPAVK